MDSPSNIGISRRANSPRSTASNPSEDAAGSRVLDTSDLHKRRPPPRQGWRPRSHLDWMMLSGVLMFFLYWSGISFLPSDESNLPATIDYVTAGVMKSGTGTLLYAFADGDEVTHSKSEMCLVLAPSFLGRWGLNMNFEKLRKLVASSLTTATSNKAAVSPRSQQQPVKVGMKCPLITFNANAIQRIDNHSPKAKYLLTIRHPVLTVESLYNYYVMLAYQIHPKLRYIIPSFDSMLRFDIFQSLGSNEFRGLVSVTHYKDHLNNFKKTILKKKSYSKNNNSPQVVLMALDQMQDKNVTRNSQFQKDLQNFLGLEQPLKNLTRATNRNTYHGKRAFPEIIDICDDQFAELRASLVKDAQSNIDWIASNFVTDPGVYVSNKEYFLEAIQGWTKDPCDQRTERLTCKPPDCRDFYG